MLGKSLLEILVRLPGVRSMVPKQKRLRERTRINKFRKAEAQAWQDMPAYENLGETGNC